MKKALLVVDYTVDFVAEDGLLTCGLPGQKLEQAITALTKQFLAQGDAVFFINDLHEKDDTLHPESKLFPHIIFVERKGAICMVNCTHYMKQILKLFG